MQAKRNTLTSDRLALESIQDGLLPNVNGDLIETGQIEKLLDLIGRLKQDASDAERMSAVTAINAFLQGYRWVSFIAPFKDGFIVLNRVDRTRVHGRNLWEHEAVQDLLNALPHLGVGKRPYVRRCENEKCRRWFFASRGDKVTCSPACHVALNRSPEWKVRKAQYMKGLRIREKKRAEHQEKQQGFTRGKRRVVSRKSRG